jgi:hypothetical protein
MHTAAQPSYLGAGGDVSSWALRSRNLLPFVMMLWSPTMPLLSCALVAGMFAVTRSTRSSKLHGGHAKARGGIALLLRRRSIVLKELRLHSSLECG